MTKKRKSHPYQNPHWLGYYLAGLWEGDGHLNIKDRSYPKPTLHITLHKKQVICLQKLMFALKRFCKSDSIGSIDIRHDNNSCVLNIYSPAGLQGVFHLIQDKLQTSALQLNSLKDWLNLKHGTNLSNVTPRATFSLNTPWFAGFVDADGSFGIDLRLTRKRVDCQFQINQRMQDPKSGLDYGELFNSIASALKVRRYTLVEKKSGGRYYVIKASSLRSKTELRNYFDTFPLLTSKKLDYNDWCKVDDLMRRNTHPVLDWKSILELKAGMNRNRTLFTWDHLNYL
jgi:hypothetical protein